MTRYLPRMICWEAWDHIQEGGFAVVVNVIQQNGFSLKTNTGL